MLHSATVHSTQLVWGMPPDGAAIRWVALRMKNARDNWTLPWRRAPCWRKMNLCCCQSNYQSMLLRHEAKTGRPSNKPVKQQICCTLWQSSYLIRPSLESPFGCAIYCVLLNSDLSQPRRTGSFYSHLVWHVVSEVKWDHTVISRLAVLIGGFSLNERTVKFFLLLLSLFYVIFVYVYIICYRFWWINICVLQFPRATCNRIYTTDLPAEGSLMENI